MEFFDTITGDRLATINPGTYARHAAASVQSLTAALAEEPNLKTEAVSAAQERLADARAVGDSEVVAALEAQLASIESDDFTPVLTARLQRAQAGLVAANAIADAAAAVQSYRALVAGKGAAR